LGNFERRPAGVLERVMSILSEIIFSECGVDRVGENVHEYLGSVVIGRLLGHRSNYRILKKFCTCLSKINPFGVLRRHRNSFTGL
jgi:hypothetical protein